MPDRPNALELIEAVTEFLSSEVLPAAADHRLKFRTLVALNALGIAYRELESSDDLVIGQEELGELARRIRAGDVDEELHAGLKEQLAARLGISNPAYLERHD